MIIFRKSDASPQLYFMGIKMWTDSIFLFKYLTDVESVGLMMFGGERLAPLWHGRQASQPSNCHHSMTRIQPNGELPWSPQIYPVLRFTKLHLCASLKDGQTRLHVYVQTVPGCDILWSLGFRLEGEVMVTSLAHYHILQLTASFLIK